MDIHGKDCNADANKDAHKEDVVNINRCHDIAIVGAGAGRTYSAYRLRNKNLNIAVYEQLDRVGGRLFSVDIPGRKPYLERYDKVWRISVLKVVRHKAHVMTCNQYFFYLIVTYFNYTFILLILITWYHIFNHACLYRIAILYFRTW